MLKAMLKKQLLELNSFYFFDRKTGKKRSGAGAAGMIALFVFLFLMLGVTFFGMAYGMSGLLETEMSWLYFAMMSLISVFLGVFGSVFNTYAALWHAKDNEMLLSMPIRPAVILFVRMLGVVLMSALYGGLVLIPTFIARWIAGATVAVLLRYVWLSLMVLAIVTVLTTALGWLVALIAARLKNKSWLTALLSMVFLFAYMGVCFNAGDFMEHFMENTMDLGNTIRNWLYPFYVMGLAAEGDMPALLGVSGVVIALCALVWAVLTATFARIVGVSGETGGKVKYREKTTRQARPFAALYRKEMMRFTGSATYMLNAGIGLVMMLIGIVMLLLRQEDIARLLPMLRMMEMQLPKIIQLIPLAGALILCMLLSTVFISAASVSMEGKNLWVLQSLPVSGWMVVKAKAALHLSIVAVPTVAACGVMVWVLKMQMADALVMAAVVLAFMVLTVVLGLMMNLVKPDLSWTNETYAVKQGFASLVVMLGSMVLVIGMGAGGFFLREMLSTRAFMGLCALVMVVADVLIVLWLKNKGGHILETL